MAPSQMPIPSPSAPAIATGAVLLAHLCCHRPEGSREGAPVNHEVLRGSSCSPCLLTHLSPTLSPPGSSRAPAFQNPHSEHPSCPFWPGSREDRIYLWKCPGLAGSFPGPTGSGWTFSAHRALATCLVLTSHSSLRVLAELCEPT